jgi:hypothetical protein
VALVPDITIDLGGMNHSELVRLAQWIGMANATRAFPRDMLMEAIESMQAPEVDNPVDARRRAMKDWLTRYWDRLQMQAPKPECPDCFSCGDLQAVECYHLNKSNFT